MKSRKLLAMLMVVVLVIVSAMPVVMAENEQHEIGNIVEYINFYDLGIVDVFCEHTGLNMEILNCPEQLEWFLYSRERMYLQQPAIEAYNLLMREFISDSNGWREFVYRDDYAGAFIDENNNLVIQLTSTDAYIVAFYNALVEYSDVVNFAEAAFSFNELNEFGRFFVDVLYESNLQVISHGIDTINNAFSISLYYADVDSVAFANSFSMMARALPVPISIELRGHLDIGQQEERAVNVETEMLNGIAPTSVFNNLLAGGTGIGSGHANTFSVGATGISPGGNALVTTGHFNGISVGLPVRRNGVEIGTVMVFRHGSFSGGNPGTWHGDWAIVRLNDRGSELMTSFLRTGERLGSISNSWISPVGTFVAGTGMTTLSWGGVVARINQEFYPGRINITTGISFVTPSGSNRPSSGDSGGTIVSGFSAAGGGLIFDGVYTGRLLHQNTGEIAYWVYTPYHWFAHWFGPR